MISIGFLLTCAAITIGATTLFIVIPCLVGRLLRKVSEKMEALHREE